MTQTQAIAQQHCTKEYGNIGKRYSPVLCTLACTSTFLCGSRIYTQKYDTANERESEKIFSYKFT